MKTSTVPLPRLTMVGVLNIAGLAGLADSAPPSTGPGTAGPVLFIVVGVLLMSGGIVIVTDYKKAVPLLYAKAMSTRRNKAPRIYGSPPAGVSGLRTLGLLHSSPAAARLPSASASSTGRRHARSRQRASAGPTTTARPDFARAITATLPAVRRDGPVSWSPGRR
jgi:hypothetical protein